MSASRSRSFPATTSMHPPDPIKRMLSWYYARIYIHVRPERIYVWPRGDIAAEPELYDAHMEEVRSGHSEEPDRFHADPGGGISAWDERLSELGSQYRTAALSLVSPDGFPFAVRVPVSIDAAARWIQIEGEPEGIPFAARPRLPDRARAWRGLHLAAELPGPGRPQADRRRLGPRASQAGRRLRDSAVSACGAARERGQGATLPPHREAGAGAPWRVVPRAPRL